MFFKTRFGLDDYFIFGSSRFWVSANKCQELRVRPFFAPAAVFAVPIAGIIMQMAGPSVAWLCLFCRKAQGGILQAAHRVHVFNPRVSAYARGLENRIERIARGEQNPQPAGNFVRLVTWPGRFRL